MKTKNNILSVDTSSWILSMSIYKNNNFYKKNIKTQDHSDTLFRCLDVMLKKTKLSIKDLNYVGVNIGPGSFTGLRVGLSFVKTLALELNLEVICVNSFDILMYEFMKKSRICNKKDEIIALFPSVKNEFYFCRYLIDNKNSKVVEIGYRKIQELIKNYSDVNFIIPNRLDLENLGNLEITKVNFSSEIIIKIFLEDKKNFYKLINPKNLFPLYIRHTYY
ncbi:MAG: tRNA (adenosine(37)-N6)-threonylcarbamoyltransferase complex dimerization subunit type 1 TsaB [Endomicrobia bacterium]|nr:tRNA (adenosine(37)-N6)-threonylcarbamoyltransferase complex dimerization subunit type 1 TsaB [Endomicrobiia bacterium]